MGSLLPPHIHNITAARPGSGASAFLEILTGPYLVQPVADQFGTDQRPLNLNRSDLAWMGVDEFAWLAAASRARGGPQVALLWGELSAGLLSGSLLKLPSGYTGRLSTTGGDLRAVVIEGGIAHSVPTVSERQVFGPGGYFQSAARVHHSLACQQGVECILYVRTAGAFEVR